MTHNFYFLDGAEAESTPSTLELVELANAGLGTEKNMFPSKNGNRDMLHQGLVETYAKLKSQNRAFELLKPESRRPLALFSTQRWISNILSQKHCWSQQNRPVGFAT